MKDADSDGLGDTVGKARSPGVYKAHSDVTGSKGQTSGKVDEDANLDEALQKEMSRTDMVIG